MHLSTPPKKKKQTQKRWLRLLSILRRWFCCCWLLFIVTPIVGVCNCSMFYFTLLYVHSSIAIILIGKRELVALQNLSSWYLVMVEWLSLAVPWGCLRFVIVVLPDHTHRVTFLKFYRRYYVLISKFQIGLKSLFRQGLSELLVYKLKRIVGSNNFPGK